MYNVKLALQLLEKKNLYKLITAFALFGLLPLFDFYCILRFGYLIGNYMALALVCLLSFAGLMVSFKILSVILDEIDQKQKRGLFPEDDFNALLGSIFAVFLIALPGITGTVLGAIILIPGIRSLFGRIISGWLGVDWQDLYEYMKAFREN